MVYWKPLKQHLDKNTRKSKVVYKGDCSCGVDGVDYIGETVKNLAVGIAEHSKRVVKGGS